MTKNDGGPAYPVPWETANNGMSLRDWFAGQALAGLASNCDNAGVFSWQVASVASRAYEIADAMLAASAKGGPDAE